MQSKGGGEVCKCLWTAARIDGEGEKKRGRDVIRFFFASAGVEKPAGLIGRLPPAAHLLASSPHLSRQSSARLPHLHFGTTVHITIS